MKVVTALVLVATFSLPVAAKTVTSTQGNTNERAAATVAGPAAAANNSAQDQAPVGDKAQPSKKKLKKSKVRTPPPMHDPN